MMGRIGPWEEEIYSVDYLSVLTTADGLDSDGERILEMGSQQEVETGAVVPVGGFHTDKGQRHTQKLRQVQPK